MSQLSVHMHSLLGMLQNLDLLQLAWLMSHPCLTQDWRKWSSLLAIVDTGRGSSMTLNATL